MSNSTVYLKNYQPPTFHLTTVDLKFELYDDHALVTSQLAVVRQHPGDLELFGHDVELISIQMDNQELTLSEYTLSEEALLISTCPDKAVFTIITRIRPQDNTALSGLYRSNSLFCTQCEAEGFRRMTYFPDRSDVLASYRTTIVADKANYPVLLSNGNLEQVGDADNGRHFATWHDPFKKPSYLFAMVAGNLACVDDTFMTCSGKTVVLRIYVEPGNENKCEHAMMSLKKAMRWDEEKYGREYDLDIFMIVAVSDFNMGAMENKGLNIFNAKYILASPDTATDQDYAGIESVVAHEYFHNWTGNRITCRDWFQLSLKEGLTVFRDQEFSRDMNSRDVNRILDVKTLRNIQFPEDAGSMAHPVRPESYQEINNFYTATIYNKGAEVIRMQQTLLGEVGFRRGMDLYFQRHDGHAVTIDDFVKAMEDANGVDFTQFKRWYSQAGTPHVDIASEYHNGQLRLTLTQSCKPTPECQTKQPFHIPIRIALLDAEGQMLPIEQPVLQLRETTQTFYFDNLAQAPIVSVCRDFSAPITWNNDASKNELLTLLRFETNGFAKWNAAQHLALNCIMGCYHSRYEYWEEQIPEALTDAYQQVLNDESLDYSLRAELLTPPSFEEAMSQFKTVDVEQLEKVRDFFRQSIGRRLFQSFKQQYERLWQAEDHAINGAAFGRRKLRNICLWFLMKACERDVISICLQQFTHAKTMTDQIASFALLVNSLERKVAINTFYQQWQHDELVLDKWFSLQASSERLDSVETINALLAHPKFHITNPNRVRAVIGAFTQANPRYFHAEDGSGYAFLTQMLLKLDKINPQIAARLATPFTRWQRLDETRQQLIQVQLNVLAEQKDLSKDLQELVMKSRVDN